MEKISVSGLKKEIAIFMIQVLVKTDINKELIKEIQMKKEVL